MLQHIPCHRLNLYWNLPRLMHNLPMKQKHNLSYHVITELSIECKISTNMLPYQMLIGASIMTDLMLQLAYLKQMGSTPSRSQSCQIGESQSTYLLHLSTFSTIVDAIVTSMFSTNIKCQVALNKSQEEMKLLLVLL